jgi:hypothetical protein
MRASRDGQVVCDKDSTCRTPTIDICPFDPAQESKMIVPEEPQLTSAPVKYNPEGRPYLEELQVVYVPLFYLCIPKDFNNETAFDANSPRIRSFTHPQEVRDYCRPGDTIMICRGGGDARWIPIRIIEPEELPCPKNT